MTEKPQVKPITFGTEEKADWLVNKGSSLAVKLDVHRSSVPLSRKEYAIRPIIVNRR
jgi:hypothetical protein